MQFFDCSKVFWPELLSTGSDILLIEANSKNSLIKEEVNFDQRGSKLLVETRWNTLQPQDVFSP